MAPTAAKASSIRFPPDLLAQLQARAQEDGSNLSAVVIEAVESFLEDKPQELDSHHLQRPEPHRLIVRSGNRVSYYVDYAGVESQLREQLNPMLHPDPAERPGARMKVVLSD